MKTFLLGLYLWLHGLIGEFVKGAADAFLHVAGGATVVQAAMPSLPAMPLPLLLTIISFAGLRDVASYLKQFPTPPAFAAKPCP